MNSSFIKTSLILVLALSLFQFNVKAQKTSLKPYGIKSGIIEYKYSGTRTGKSIMYFDDYGLLSAVKNDITSFGNNEKGWIISIKDDQYKFDPEKSDEGIKMKNPILEAFFEMEQKDFDKFADELYSRMGFKKAGTEKFLNKDCVVYKGDLGKILAWNGLLLYSETEVGGIKASQEAVSVKVNVPIDRKYFEIPKNIKFKEVPSLDDIDKLIDKEDDSED